MAVFNKLSTWVTKGSVSKFALAFLFVFLASIGFSESAQASFFGDLFGVDTENDLSDISENIVDSVSTLPGLLTALSYLIAILLGVTGILKLKEHVENPGNGAGQVPLRVPMIRFIVGGALLALPGIFESMYVTINGSLDPAEFESGNFDAGNAFSGISGIISNVLGGAGLAQNLNFVFASIVSSVRFVPGLITAVAYLLGLLFGVIGLIKIKDHVESPEQTPLKEGVIRLLIGGAMFAIPTLYTAMQVTVAGDGDLNLGGVLAIVEDISNILGNEATCNSVEGLLGGVVGTFGDGQGSSLGGVMCNVITGTAAFSAFLAAISYLFGLVLGIWGILKIQDHVLNPQQTQLWEGISRFIAAGCFFSLPFMIEVFKNTIAPESLADHAFNVIGIFDDIGGFINDVIGIFGGGGGDDASVCNGLDGAINCFVTDIFAPLSTVINVFSMFAGMVLIMIGISRLMKSAQEGARGPGGIGTMMTFLTGGALISYTELLGASSNSIFNSSKTLHFGALKYTDGMLADEIANANIVISAILKFMILVGLISFVRGIFIIRNVAEGNQQASLMAGVTHMVGGALAVNMGPLLSAVQTTLGITGYGVEFAAQPIPIT